LCREPTKVDFFLAVDTRTLLPGIQPFTGLRYPIKLAEKALAGYPDQR
jgi:hypothetical protein